MHVAHNGFRCRVLDRQTQVELRQRRRDPRILVAQPMHELNRQSIGKRRAFMGEKDDGDGLGGSSPNPEQAAGEAGALLLIAPNQLGVDDNAHVAEPILKHFAPAFGWR
jgi:hypothetical protein